MSKKPEPDPDFDACQTTTLTVQGPGGTGASVKTRRVSELVATLALVVLALSAWINYDLRQDVAALAMAINARSAEALSKQSDVAAALRELVCIQLLPEAERRLAGQSCKTIARMQ